MEPSRGRLWKYHLDRWNRNLYNRVAQIQEIYE